MKDDQGLIVLVTLHVSRPRRAQVLSGPCFRLSVHQEQLQPVLLACILGALHWVIALG